MAISSVARKATIREDRSIRDAMQIIGRQQALAGRLAIDKQKAEQAAIKQRNEETSKQFKTLRDIDSPYSPYNEQFDAEHESVENTLINPDISFIEKEKRLTDLSQFTKQTGVVKAAIIKNSKDRVGTEEQRRLRNADEIAKAQVSYVMDADGNPIDPNDFDQQAMDEHVDNGLKTYNIPNNVEGFMSQQKDIVATEISSKNMASGFSRNDVITKASKFLVLTPDGTDYETVDGKPIANITSKNLEAFEAYSRGNKLAIDDYLSKPANAGKTRLDGMKDVLEKNGWLTAKETREVKISATPKPSATDAVRAQQIAIVRNRIKVFDESIAEGGGKILSQLKSGKAVVEHNGGKGEERKTTGVTKIPGGLKFTIVVDPLRFVDKIKEGFTFATTKTGKFMVREVDVLNSDPLTGLIELSAVYDQTVGSKFEVDPVDFIEQYQDVHKGDVKDPFGGAFSGSTNPFQVDIK